MSKLADIKIAWKEFKVEMKEMNLRHKICEQSIKLLIDKMTVEDMNKPFTAEMQALWNIQEGMGGIRRFRIAKHGVKKMYQLRKEERRNE